MSVGDLRLNMVVRGTVDRSMLKTVAQTSRHGKQLGATFEATNKKLAATDKVLKYTRGLENLRKELDRSGGTNAKAAAGI